jgi:hypothetical protein
VDICECIGQASVGHECAECSIDAAINVEAFASFEGLEAPLRPEAMLVILSGVQEDDNLFPILLGLFNKILEID